MRKLLLPIAVFVLAVAAAANAGCGTSSAFLGSPTITQHSSTTPTPTPTPTLVSEVFKPSDLHLLARYGYDTGRFNASEGGCDPSSFTAHSEDGSLASVGGNDGSGNFQVRALKLVNSTTFIDVTDCHGFTTSPSTTPASVMVQLATLI